jgi:isoleucyl-tRNA synthetase
MIDLELERGMNAVRALVDASANIRQQANLKLRWPVQKAIVQTSTQELKVLLMKLESVLKSQLNCKELVLLGPNDVVGELKCKPKVENLTKRFRSLAPAVEETLKNMEALRLRAELERYGFFGIQVVGQKVKLTKDDVEFEVVLPEGFASASTDAGKIMIDVRLTPQLKAECLARELVRRLQTMRKEQDLAMEERVDVEIGSDNAEYLKLLATQREYIIREVRVQNLRLCATAEVGAQGYVKEWEIDSDKFKLSLKRLAT